MRKDFAQKLTHLKSELGDTKLLIVSKTRSLGEIKAYYDLGHRDFGENRVQDLAKKAEALIQDCPEIRWHFIGHLQSNKIKKLLSVSHLYAIHSVDRLSILKILIHESSELEKQKNDRKIKVFLQFNTSLEVQKSGFQNFEDLLEAALLLQGDRFQFSNGMILAGLMTMGSIRTENFEAEAHRCFQELQFLKKQLETRLNTFLETSMGMSQDYKIALQYDSNWVRLGTVMFENDKNKLGSI